MSTDDNAVEKFKAKNTNLKEKKKRRDLVDNSNSIRFRRRLGRNGVFNGKTRA